MQYQVAGHSTNEDDPTARYAVCEYVVGRETFRDIFLMSDAPTPHAMNIQCGRILEALNAVMPTSSFTHLFWLGIQ